MTMTKRKEPRFRAYVPLLVTLVQGNKIVVPHDISTSACYFDFRDSTFGTGSYTVQIVLDRQNTVTISNANYFDHGNSGGFGLRWSLGAHQAAQLLSFLRQQSNQPSIDSKVAYLTAEQNNFSQNLREISDQEQKGYRFLFILIAGYFAYQSAPLHFTFKTLEQAGFYAVGGLWASVILIFQNLRFLRWLGNSVRRRVFLIQALSTNQSWVFNDDGTYYAKSVLPLGTAYDDSRAWSWIKPSNDKKENRLREGEKWLLQVDYKWSTSVFHFLIQALFAFGSIQFLSLIFRVWKDKDVSLLGSVPNLFDASSFTYVYPIFSIVLLFWIQVSANECSHYQQRVWEARRISTERPNPRFTGRAFYNEHPKLDGLFKSLMYLALALVVCAPAVVTELIHFLPRWVYTHVVAGTTAVLMFFFAGKILYSYVQIRSERNLNKSARPISE